MSECARDACVRALMPPPLFFLNASSNEHATTNTLTTHAHTRARTSTTGDVSFMKVTKRFLIDSMLSSSRPLVLPAQQYVSSAEHEQGVLNCQMVHSDMKCSALSKASKAYGVQLLACSAVRQYLYFCTSKASKLSTAVKQPAL